MAMTPDQVSCTWVAQGLVGLCDLSPMLFSRLSLIIQKNEYFMQYSINLGSDAASSDTIPSIILYVGGLL
jgi:hypothetical protein